MDQDRKVSLKIPIMHKDTPYVYIKMGLDNERYRLSANYKYLNEQYNLKMSFIRNLRNINNKNRYFTIIDDEIFINRDFETDIWSIGEGDNTLDIEKIVLDNTSIIFLKRKYHDKIDHSIFFASTVLSHIDQTKDV